MEVAAAAQNFDALRHLHSDTLRLTDHPTGRDLDLDERQAGAELGAADVLPLPFEPALEVDPAAPVAAPVAMTATPKPGPASEPAGTTAFEPEAPAAVQPEPANALAEFDSEPEGAA